MKILLCRSSAQKIVTDSGKKLQKIILQITNHKAQTQTSTAIPENLPCGTPFKKSHSNNLIKKNKIKNSHTTKNYHKDHRNSQNQIKDPKHAAPKSSPYDPENPRQESQSKSKDITGKDIEKDLIENNPSKGSQTDMDTQKSDEAQSGTFETIAPEKDNPVEREFEIGQLGQEELKEDEITRDETGNGSPGNHKPSQRKF